LTQRKRYFTELTNAKLAPGTVEKIEANLEGGETVSSFIRSAIQRELRRRQKHRISTPAPGAARDNENDGQG
jgi:hypothetical protein